MDELPDYLKFLQEEDEEIQSKFAATKTRGEKADSMKTLAEFWEQEKANNLPEAIAERDRTRKIAEGEMRPSSFARPRPLPASSSIGRSFSSQDSTATKRRAPATPATSDRSRRSTAHYADTEDAPTSLGIRQASASSTPRGNMFSRRTSPGVAPGFEQQRMQSTGGRLSQESTPGSNVGSSKKEALNDYPIHIIVPKNAENADWTVESNPESDDWFVRSEDIPRDLREYLAERLHGQIVGSKRIQAWNRMKPCVDVCVLHNAISRNGKPVFPTAWRACTTCAKTSNSTKTKPRVCALLQEDTDGTRCIVVLPLPEELRVGKSWEDREFWVRSVESAE
ncbi:hypothetical protein P153DRAFT_388981 [Dothidotthia symphoricarpi CBS 119687]|uniref:Uncharacterized protein n=1 Tax=Dothidotthia symphoricarpi CBS 119687 TaxID=1392245 RepID=A0A6A6A641_9PLEO|nr:uncharacterized protein P153DRAFT_388981 [Dothidotthia symphoricarpi CBS 119687]KAF2126238.1 hypothetical protein P153DRAFT_388981 [Dothidotthia symphoricarpi CBS 119687]